MQTEVLPSKPREAALAYLSWLESLSHVGFEPTRLGLRLEVILPDSCSEDEKSLVIKILESVPFEISELARVSQPGSDSLETTCLDLTGRFQHPPVFFSAALADLIKSPELKKQLWTDLRRFSESRKGL
jgi:hypothetical protein